jgi:hypothetical protein
MVKRAVIDRTYSKRINTVGAVYDRAFIISQHAINGVVPNRNLDAEFRAHPLPE